MISELQDTIGYHFKDESLLITALTHTSYVNEQNLDKTSSNQRLEYLGDAVLELSMTNILFNILVDSEEGILSGVRANLVCTASLAKIARELSLGDYILLGKGAQLGCENENPTVLEDAFEALVGAIFLDAGYESAEAFVKKAMGQAIEDAVRKIEENDDYRDSKTLLQIKLQQNGSVKIDYRLIKKEGPPHNAIFYVDVYVTDNKLGSGFGPTKKEAEQAAARDALVSLSNGRSN